MSTSDPARRLLGKVAVVTGASAGNGRAIARRLAREGASVICADLRPEPHDPTFDGETPTHELIEREGGRATFAAADVSDGDAVTAMYARGLEAFGRLDIVVANAGISPQPPLHLPEEQYDTYARVMRVNADGAWWTCREGSRILREQGEGGRIILISSIAGLLGTDSGAHYCMSKGAVNQLAKALAFQMAPHRITVNSVCPGFVRTSMTADYLSDPERAAAVIAVHPLGRVGEADDIAGAVFFLAGDDASWVTGIHLSVDGGYAAV
jgi:NAD(P)-dependent dehydrogenase (short-subunit alcohol dehydrogenase family)